MSEPANSKGSKTTKKRKRKEERKKKRRTEKEERKKKTSPEGLALIDIRAYARSLNNYHAVPSILR